jgi:hypothetical protein
VSTLRQTNATAAAASAFDLSGKRVFESHATRAKASDNQALIAHLKR